MSRMPMQGKTIEVSMPQFLDFFRKWVQGCKYFVVSCVSNHIAGLGDFSGSFAPKWFESIKMESRILDSEIENQKMKSLFHELLDVVEKTWLVEQEIINEYQ